MAVSRKFGRTVIIVPAVDVRKWLYWQRISGNGSIYNTHRESSYEMHDEYETMNAVRYLEFSTDPWIVGTVVVSMPSGYLNTVPNIIAVPYSLSILNKGIHNIGFNPLIFPI